MARRTKKMGLTPKIIIGMLAGLAVGLFLNLIGLNELLQEYIVDGAFHIAGRVFVASLKLLVVPIVFVSLVCGTAALGDLRELGKVGGKTIGLYLTTTAVAITLALGIALFTSPGKGFQLDADTTFSVEESPPLSEVIINIFPTNPIQAMAEGNMLQIIVFALLFGFALNVTGVHGKRVLGAFKDINEVLMKLVLLLMQIAPYGVFFLIAKVFAEEGFSAFAPLLKYFFTVVAVLAIHGMVTYPSLLKTLSGLNPLQFAKNWKTPLAFAFSTASSNATIPITLEAAEHRCGVKNSIASFTIPLGATINMDGTAIMQGVATIFVAQAYGMDLTMVQLLMVILTATLASIGTAGVPGVGLIMLAMVFRQVGLPIEGIGLVLGVDRLLDMMRTAVNVTGDGAITCIVAKSEKQLSESVFYAENKKDSFS